MQQPRKRIEQQIFVIDRGIGNARAARVILTEVPVEKSKKRM